MIKKATDSIPEKGQKKSKKTGISADKIGNKKVEGSSKKAVEKSIIKNEKDLGNVNVGKKISLKVKKTSINGKINEDKVEENVKNIKKKETVVKKNEKKNVNDVAEKKKNTSKQFTTIGRRKTSVARVFMQSGSGNFSINNNSLEAFTKNFFLNYKILQPLNLIDGVNNFDIKINVSGGGKNSQVEAIRLGIAKNLLNFDQEYRKVLKDHNFLTRDSRMVERKKFGHKKARRSFQFSKR